MYFWFQEGRLTDSARLSGNLEEQPLVSPFSAQLRLCVCVCVCVVGGGGDGLRLSWHL